MLKHLGLEGKRFACEHIAHTCKLDGRGLGYPRDGRLEVYTFLPEPLVKERYDLERTLGSEELVIDWEADPSERELLAELERLIQVHRPEQVLAIHPYEMLFEIELAPGIDLVPYEGLYYLLGQELITPENILLMADQVWAVHGGCAIVGTPYAEDPLDMHVNFYVLPAFDGEWFAIARPEGG